MFSFRSTGKLTSLNITQRRVNLNYMMTKAKTTAMTNTNANVHMGLLGKGEARFVTLNRVKMFYIRDLVKANGRGFMKHLPEGYTTLRIKHNNNSQLVRLVSAVCFKTALNKLSKIGRVTSAPVKLKTTTKAKTTRKAKTTTSGK